MASIFGRTWAAAPYCIAVVKAIHVKVRRVLPGAIDGRERSLPALRTRHYAVHQERQIREIAPVQGEVVDFLLHDHVAFDGAVFSIENGNLRGDMDRFADASNIDKILSMLAL